MLNADCVKECKAKENFLLEDVQMFLMKDINPDGLPSECIH